MEEIKMVMKEIGIGGLLVTMVAGGCAYTQYVSPENKREYNIVQELFKDTFENLSENEKKNVRFCITKERDGYYGFAYIESDGSEGFGTKETKIAVKRIPLEIYIEHFAGAEERKYWNALMEAGRNEIKAFVENYNAFAEKNLAADENISLDDYHKIQEFRMNLDKKLEEEEFWGTETRNIILGLKEHINALETWYANQLIYVYSLGCATTDGSQRNNLSYTANHNQILTGEHATIEELVNKVLGKEKVDEIKKKALAEWESTNGRKEDFGRLWTRLKTEDWLRLVKEGNAGKGVSEYPLCELVKEGQNGQIYIGSGRTLLEGTTAINALNRGAPLTKKQVENVKYLVPQKTVPDSGKK